MNSDRSKSYKRATAIKLYINHILSGTYVKDDGNNYLETFWGVHVSRVHILGTIVRKWVPPVNNESKSDRTPHASLTVDDGTETIRLKAWKDDIKIFEDFQLGDIIDVIGHVREYETEKYIAPEIIKRIENPNWELIHEISLIESLHRLKSDLNPPKISAEAPQIRSQGSEDITMDKHQKSIFTEKIVDLIRNLDEGQGVSSNQLKSKIKIPEMEFQNAMMDLINEGTIYQPSPGKYRIL